MRAAETSTRCKRTSQCWNTRWPPRTGSSGRCYSHHHRRRLLAWLRHRSQKGMKTIQGMKTGAKTHKAMNSINGMKMGALLAALLAAGTMCAGDRQGGVVEQRCPAAMAASPTPAPAACAAEPCGRAAWGFGGVPCLGHESWLQGGQEVSEHPHPGRRIQADERLGTSR